MYRVIIYGCPDEFAVAVHGKEFNRRGLIRFLSRHINKLLDYDYVAIEWLRASAPRQLLVCWDKAHERPDSDE